MKNNIKKPELCIPRMSCDIPKEFIFHIFCRLKIGFIERITEFPLRNGAVKCVIIRLKWNLSTDKAKYIYNRLTNGEPVFVVYDDDIPFYWKIVANETPTDKILPPPAYTGGGVIDGVDGGGGGGTVS